MDITEGSEQRFQIGIEQFAAGQTLVYHEVVFWKDPAGYIVVTSFSDHVEPENSSPAEAAEKIERSKAVLRSLAERSAAFASLAGSLPHKYEFCWDYGTGSVRLAWEEGGKVLWRG